MQLTGSRLLVVEDVRDTQSLLQADLTSAGADVVVSENVHDACQAVRNAEDEKCPFDLILIDVSMPVGNGIETAHQLRSQGYTKPIIAFAAQPLLSDREKYLKAGCDDFEAKPISRDSLIKIVRAWKMDSRFEIEKTLSAKGSMG